MDSHSPNLERIAAEHRTNSGARLFTIPGMKAEFTFLPPRGAVRCGVATGHTPEHYRTPAGQGRPS